MNENVAIAVLALELGVDIDRLAQTLADHVTIDASGCRAVAVDVAAQFVANEHAAANTRRERRDARRQRTAAAHQASIEALRARRAVIERRDAAMLADPSMTALECMLVGASIAKMNARGERDSEMRRGISSGSTFGKRGI